MPEYFKNVSLRSHHNNSYKDPSHQIHANNHTILREQQKTVHGSVTHIKKIIWFDDSPYKCKW